VLARNSTDLQAGKNKVTASAGWCALFSNMVPGEARAVTGSRRSCRTFAAVGQAEPMQKRRQQRGIQHAAVTVRRQELARNEFPASAPSDQGGGGDDDYVSVVNTMASRPPQPCYGDCRTYIVHAGNITTPSGEALTRSLVERLPAQEETGQNNQLQQNLDTLAILTHLQTRRCYGKVGTLSHVLVACFVDGWRADRAMFTAVG